MQVPQESEVEQPLQRWQGLPFETVLPPKLLHLERLELPESMLWVTTEGSADHTWRQDSMLLRSRIRPGVAAFKLSGNVLRDYRTDGHYEGCRMQFPETQVRSLMGDDAYAALRSLRGGAHYEHIDDPFLFQVMRTIAAEVKSGCPMGSAFSEGISIAIVSYLARLRNGVATENAPIRDTVRMERVKCFIEDHLSSDPSLGDIAAYVHLSPRQLARTFKATMGCSVHQYILERRVANAKIMLGKYSASAVAIDLGFSSSSHFAQTFRSFTGVSPSEYRRSVFGR